MYAPRTVFRVLFSVACSAFAVRPAQGPAADASNRTELEAQASSLENETSSWTLYYEVSDTNSDRHRWIELDTDQPGALTLDFSPTDKPMIRALRGVPGAGTTLELWTCMKPGNSSVRHQYIIFYGHVQYLDNHYVGLSPPMVVQSIWAELLNESTADAPGAESYEIILDYEFDRLTGLLMTLGAAPALIAIYAALCSMPCVWHQFCLGKVLSPVPSRSSGDSEAQTYATESTARRVQSNMLVPFEQVETMLQMSMQPSQKVQDVRFTRVIDMKFVMPVVLLCNIGTFCMSVTCNLPLMLIEPKPVAIEIMRCLLESASCVFLVYGLRRAKESPLISPGCACPCDHGVELDTVLEKHLFWKTFVPYSPVLFCMVPLVVWICLEPCYLMYISQLYNVQDKIVPGLATLNRCLLRMVFFRFLLDVSVLARLVEAHVEAVTRMIFTVCRVHVGATSSSNIDAERMKLLHALVVKVSITVLPCLDSIGMPAVMFVVCGCGQALLATLRILAESDRMETAFFESMCYVFPELLACVCLIPLTAVSDACDCLRLELNALRAVSHASDDAQIRMTEAYIKKANNGQGLGFVMYGTGMVVNKRALVMMGVKLLTVASIALAIIQDFIRDQRQFAARLSSK